MDSISWMSLREVAGQNTARATKPLHPLPSVLRKELAATECKRFTRNPGHRLQSGGLENLALAPSIPLEIRKLRPVTTDQLSRMATSQVRYPRHLDSEFLTRPDWWEADFKRGEGRVLSLPS